MTFRPISISLSPNTERNDIQLALKLIFQPWQWKKGREIFGLEENFKKYLGVKYAISFNSGRSALMAILNAIQENDSSFAPPPPKQFRLRRPGKAASFAEVASATKAESEDKEVLLQAFTCNAVPNPILWARLRQDFGGQARLKPVYVDCNTNTFNLDFEDLKRKITPRSKVLIVQHTFGLPDNMDEILKICKENNLILIEDCAHSLGARYKEKLVGKFGKAAFFSFSRDKVISCVYGGMAVTNDDALAEKIRNFQKKSGFPSNFWILQQLLHPVLLNFFILPIYSFLRIGKTSLNIFQWLHILSKAVHWKEKRGKSPGYFPKALPNALATLALFQLQKLEKFNQHRKKIAEFYFNELRGSPFQLPKISPEKEHIFLRFPVKHPRAHQIIKKAWKENILIGDWYDSPIAPKDTKLEKMQYQMGSCPKAEKLSRETLNLPTHINISAKEAQRIIDFLKTYGN